jgi:hypothetical protein
MALWVSRYFIAKTQDKELHTILEYAEEIAMIEVDKSKSFLEEAKFPLQYGEDSMNLMIEHKFIDQLPMAKEKPSVPSST